MKVGLYVFMLILNYTKTANLAEIRNTAYTLDFGRIRNIF